ncbi:MAG TPA: AAA family ATPase [Candidatus Binatia bacterium]|nr:AAA family ATPase [Candidatus Binatia bacterium]
MPPTPILLVEADPEAAAPIEAALAAAGHPVTRVATAADALRAAAGVGLVVIDVLPEGESAVELCRDIRRTPALAAVAVMCVAQSDDVEERIRFLEAGADDVVVRGFDARELEARVDALILRFQRSRRPEALGGLVAERPEQRTIVVFSPKGGVGTTTIATNIAVAAATKTPDRVCIIDLVLQFGQVATHLNLEPRQTIADLVRDEPALSEPELLRTYALRHDSGCHVLPAPVAPDNADLVTADHVRQILGTALGTYDRLVVDAGSRLDERVLAALEVASGVVLPISPEIAALKALHTVMEYLNESGAAGGRTTFVLNRIFARDILRPRDIETALGARIDVELPYDPFIYLKAVNEGDPVVRGAPRSAPAAALTRLAERVFGGDGAEGAPAHATARRGLLGGLLGR